MHKDVSSHLESILNSLIDHVPAKIFWKNTDLVYLGCNDAFVHSLGLQSKDEVIGKRDFDLPVEREASVAYREDDRRVIESKRPHLDIEESQTLSDGTTRTLSTSKVPLMGEDGKVYGVLGIYFDITDRKMMEIALAEIASQAKSDFISNMEHDLRTPFTGIRGVAELLYDKESDDEKKALLTIMLQSCKQWENVHNHILEALTVEKFVPLHLEWISVSQAFQEIQDRMAAILHIKKLQCEIKAVPKKVEWLYTDKLKFSFILSSLMSNAVKFTEQGKIILSMHAEGKWAVLQAEDTGIGIPQTEWERIFEQFTKLSRSNTHASDFQGVGLGLYITKKYATQLGATVTLDSTVGKGSVFSVKFPLDHEHKLP